MKRRVATESNDNWAAVGGEASNCTVSRRDTGEGRNSTALREQYLRLKGSVEGSARIIDGGCGTVSSEAADLQRRAIAALHECATMTLSLSQFLGKAAGPSAATCRYLGTRIHWGASFNEQAHEFLESARNFVLVLTSCAQPDSSCSTWPSDRAQSPRDSLQDCLAALSPTQQRAFNLLLKGLPNKLIAYELGLAESTVKAHMSSLFRKLHVRSRAQVLVLAADLKRQKGLVPEFEPSRPDAKRAPCA
jgi:DNA-binding CsgD family transcriptional regulator